MPNVTVTNTNGVRNPIAVLGLGKLASGATKAGTIPDAQYAPYATRYRTRAYIVGVVFQEDGGPVPDGVQIATTTSTQSAGKKIVLLDSSSGTFVHTLLAASSVAEGTAVTFFNKGSANQATLTAAGSDKIGDGVGTTHALTTSSRRVVLVSNGVDRWTISST